MRRYSTQEKLSAMADFVAGKSVPRISQERGIPLHTVKNWYTRNDWGKKRGAVRRASTARVLNRIVGQQETIILSCLEAAANLARQAEAHSRGADEKQIAELQEIGKLALLCAALISKAGPVGQDQLISDMMERLEEANENDDTDLVEER